MSFLSHFVSSELGPISTTATHQSRGVGCRRLRESADGYSEQNREPLSYGFNTKISRPLSLARASYKVDTQGVLKMRLS